MAVFLPPFFTFTFTFIHIDTLPKFTHLKSRDAYRKGSKGGRSIKVEKIDCLESLLHSIPLHLPLLLPSHQ